MKGEPLASRSNPISIHPWPTPLLCVLSGAPAIWTRWFLKRGAMHNKGCFVMSCGYLLPMIGNGIHSFTVIEVLFEVIFWVVVNENRRIPASIECGWPSMKTFGRFIKQQVTTSQDDLMSPSLKILNLKKEYL
jgi:hypothetical protein